MNNVDVSGGSGLVWELTAARVLEFSAPAPSCGSGADYRPGAVTIFLPEGCTG